jgi:hypothetical protein
MNLDIQIAGKKTVRGWLNLKNLIEKDFNNEALWNKAFTFFKDRLFTRYINPAEKIQNDICSEFVGEGFAISTILCSLIEALETFYQGKHFTPQKPQNEYEYTNGHSKEIFKNFLTQREPFKSEFKSLASDFYYNVRCSLLHEAATRNGWVIRVDTARLIEKDGDKKVLNRCLFIGSVKKYIKSYKQELLKDNERKKAFIRKMDSICNTA